ncbi:thiamine pyrophosphate-binding protein [Amycolatopsis thermophila]|uniref:Thiamine pyrophosphate-dependent acetolactate synthase large subunit-like protein n=1 Tax=Amycolatopsis thermophila TaxID=206084 RepID=A0ABU0EZ87_9PSEU|nr:thiamine pyrophosphate-binding protein [Amycolatopsis thermophila]MDQ0380424.1 thiamine pyrophosphate-dependent acetolactate synthase large subunit-like protein [Amycolatopsis thermophila]
MIVAEAVGRVLAQLGAGPVFGVVGSGNFHVTNALRDAGVPFHATRHEGGAATAADACARMSDRVALVSTHQGCGLTNAVTGIGEAAKSRTPLIVLTADTPAGDPLNNFRIDQDGLARAVGATAARVHSPDTAVADTVRAYTTALHERRTVVLNLPLDVQAMPAPPLDPVAPVGKPPVLQPDPAAVTELAALLTGAERPVFVAGRGGRGAAAEIRALADACGALLATSAVAHGLFHGDPWALGISGGFASPLAADLIRGADLVVGWGCALNRWTTRQGKLIGPGARLAQVDVEAGALGAHRPIDAGVVGDAGATARAVLAELGGRVAPGYRSPGLRARIAARARWSTAEFTDCSTAELIDPRTLSAELDRILPTERVVSVDSGNFMGYPSAYLHVPDEFGFCFTQAFQSIGLGLATAIGAAIAQPARLPVAALGDGGFHMAAGELETAVRLGLPLMVVVYNDAAYGAEVHHFTGDHTTVRFPPTDIAAIARGFGCTGVTVRTTGDLRHVTSWLDGPRDTPLVVDAKITDDGGSWWLAEAFHGH